MAHRQAQSRWLGLAPAACVALAGGLQLFPRAKVSAESVDSHDTHTQLEPGSFHHLDESKAQLKLVQIVFRHGARTPLTKRSHLWQGQIWDVCGPAYQPIPLEVVSTKGQPSPANPDNDRQVSARLEGGCHMGELTQTGQMQALALGQWLRERYVDRLRFLPQSLEDERALAARTTNFQRTIATLAGVLTGLYPQGLHGSSGGSSGPASGSSGSEPRPLRVVTSSDVDEILYADSKFCPHLGSFMALAAQQSKRASKRDYQYAWARQRLKLALGVEDDFFTSKWCWTDVHDAMMALKAHGKPLPPGMDDEVLAAVNRLATKELSAYVSPKGSLKGVEYGHDVLRLSMGRLLHTLVTNMEEAVARGSSGAGGSSGGSSGDKQGQGQQQARLYLYSGHDSSVLPLLAAMGLSIETWPPFLSNLIFELWELPAGDDSSASGSSSSSSSSGSSSSASGRRHVVRVLYNQHELQLPDCPPGAQPSLDAFRQVVVGPVIISQADFNTACRVTVTHDTSLPQPQAVAAADDA